ncbi:MAG: metallopeptidase TldD-related protein, partial [Planctomycetota bacterium]
WFATHNFHLDWSFYLEADRAVKCSYAGEEWQNEEFARRVDAAAAQLEVLGKKARPLRPGAYRVYLAPTAVAEIVGILSWGGFSLRAQRSGGSALLRMVKEGARLSEAVTLSEHAALGIAPAFNSGGYLKPERIPLIERGAYREALVSPRSAAEYDASPNGAEEMEFPDSADMEAGEMPAAEAAERLGDGLYINHLHYLNYSDRPAGRITGLTRFACFWVEGGRIAAPIPVMRFDDSIYRILGENLVALTAERELLPDPDTYAARSTGGALLPGALIESFTLTL